MQAAATANSSRQRDGPKHDVHRLGGSTATFLSKQDPTLALWPWHTLQVCPSLPLAALPPTWMRGRATGVTRPPGDASGP